MPVLPVTTVRTSWPLSNQRLLFQLNADQIALQRQHDHLSTGKRVLRLSDDPAAASRAMGQRQLALEASMRLIGKTSQMTVLNFL